MNTSAAMTPDSSGLNSSGSHPAAWNPALVPTMTATQREDPVQQPPVPPEEGLHGRKG